MTTHINAEWEIVVDPKKARVGFFTRAISTTSESAEGGNHPDADFPTKSRTRLSRNARSPGTACRNDHARHNTRRPALICGENPLRPYG